MAKKPNQNENQSGTKELEGQKHYPESIMGKNFLDVRSVELNPYFAAMIKEDHGEYFPMSELIIAFQDEKFFQGLFSVADIMFLTNTLAANATSIIKISKSDNLNLFFEEKLQEICSTYIKETRESLDALEKILEAEK